MDRKDIIIMSPEELRRVSVINQSIGRLITPVKAAEVIGVSDRQARRLIKRVRGEGNKGIIHRLRGKPGQRRIDDEIKTKVIELCKKKYWDFGPTFASTLKGTGEKLYELDKIKVNHDDTFRCWLIAADKDKWDWQRTAK